MAGHTGLVLVEVIGNGAAASRALVDSHPGLLEALSVVETDAGECAVVWPAGETLADRLVSYGPMPWHRAAELMAAVADAVEYVHGRGMHHGAIEPGLVQFGADRQPHLGGFGLADLWAANPAGGRAVDERFSAPEVAASGVATQIGDVYSLGAVLSAALMGGEAASSTELLPDDVPEAVAYVVGMAMSRYPIDRYTSAGGFAESLRAARDHALYGDDDDDDDDDDVEADGPVVVHQPVPSPPVGGATSTLLPPPPPEVTPDEPAEVPSPVPTRPVDVTEDTTPAQPKVPVEASAPVTLPEIDPDDWYAVNQHRDWESSVNAVVTSEVLPVDEGRAEVPVGLDEEERRITTLADAERAARRRGSSWDQLPDVIPVETTAAVVAGGRGSTATLAEAERSAVPTAPPVAAVPPGPPVLTVVTGRTEVDEPVEGDVLVTGGQLVVRAEVRGTVTIDGGRAVVFAPVTGDIINVGGIVSIEAPVGGRIRGQREFTTVRPGSQDV